MSDQVQQNPENDPDFIDPSIFQIPVYLYEKGLELPKRGRYYVVARDGVYIHMDGRYGSALCKCDGIPWLEDAHNDIDLRLPKVPARIVGQALGFFRQVWKKHRAEACVMIYYSEERQQYMLWCPQQHVSGASVNYDRDDEPDLEARTTDDWHLVGTIHSHCNFSAFHSGTDEYDEATFDGLHITLGHVDSDDFSMVASMAIGAGNNDTDKKAKGFRERLDVENCATGVVRTTNRRVSGSKWMTWGDATYFNLELTDDDKAALEQDMVLIEQNWMPKVTSGWRQGGCGFGFQSQSQGGFDPKKKRTTDAGGHQGGTESQRESLRGSLTDSSDSMISFDGLDDDLFPDDDPEQKQWLEGED